MQVIFADAHLHFSMIILVIIFPITFMIKTHEKCHIYVFSHNTHMHSLPTAYPMDTYNKKLIPLSKYGPLIWNTYAYIQANTMVTLSMFHKHRNIFLNTI
jgi:hypothetical protein